MKELFKQVNEDPQFMKTHKMGLKKYFQLLHTNLGDDFKKVAKASDECINNVWFEFDEKETNYVTWHQIRPLIKRIEEHSDELDGYMAEALEKQAAYIKGKEEAAAEKERLRQEALLAEEAEASQEENE